MIKEEAINNLKYLISEECKEGHFAFIPEIQIAIKALEKQMPKKVKWKRQYADLYVGHCPCCMNGINSEMDYCDRCGQAIDWSEE